MKYGKPTGGALLVAGTAIGAGMLALPVVTALGGFLPATLIYLLCYLFSAATGLLFLEICLYMPKESNLISMAGHLLGPLGRAGAWVLYLFLFYCLDIAYVAGGGNFVSHLFNCPLPIGLLLFTLFFGTVVFMGTRAVDRINWVLMIGLGVSFAAFLAIGFGSVQVDLLSRVQWGPALLALPVIFTSFSYQGIVPSLTTYLNRDPKQIRFAILVGTALPFLAYIVWEALILGLIPPDHLALAKEKGLTAVEPLKRLFPDSSIYIIGQCFGIFALTTSFLGVTLGLLDFLADGLRVSRQGISRFFLCALIYIPPMVIAAVNPKIFLSALGYAGGIGCAILLGFYPALMAYVARYRRLEIAAKPQLFGGKAMLVLLMVFVAFELVIEFLAESL